MGLPGRDLVRHRQCGAVAGRRVAARRLRADRRRVPRHAGGRAMRGGGRRHHRGAGSSAACAAPWRASALIARPGRRGRRCSCAFEWTHRARRRPSRYRWCRATCRRRKSSIPRFGRATTSSTTISCARAKGRIVVLPESAYPQFADEIPGSVFLRLAAAARARDGAILVGLFVAEPPRRARRGRAHLQQRGEPRRGAAAALSQASPRSVRRIDSAEAARRLVHQLACWRFRSPTRRRGRPGSRRSRSPASGIAVNICYEDVFGAELIAAARDGNAARQRHQRRVVWPLDRRAPAQPDRRHARARNRPPDAARDQHRHHVGHRARWPRDLASCRGSSRGILEIEIAGRTRRHALPALRRLAGGRRCRSRCCVAAALDSPQRRRGNR